MRYLILIAALILFTGCKSKVAEVFEEAVEKSFPCNSTGTLRITNVDGAVRIYGGDEGLVRMKARKRAYSEERLRAISLRISSRPESLSIETIFPPAGKWSLRDRSGVVDYVLVVPQSLKTVDVELTNGEISIDGLEGGNVRARLVNGRLSARDSFANLDYQTRSGAIDFYYNWWEEPGEYRVKAAAANGNIGVFLPRAASFRIDAETRGGGIMSNLIEEDERIPTEQKKISLQNGSRPDIRFQLNASKGNIRLHGY